MEKKCNYKKSVNWGEFRVYNCPSIVHQLLEMKGGILFTNDIYVINDLMIVC